MIRLEEFTTNRGVTLDVDEANGVVHNVKVLGMHSVNGRKYPKKVIEAARHKYEGAKVNVDHARNDHDPRRYSDRFGRLSGVRCKEDGLYADLHYNPKHQLAEQFAWDARHAPENVGLSHVIEATAKRSNGEMTVEEISRVVSVDIVADPATTKSLFESQQHNTEDDPMPEITVDAVKAASSVYNTIREEITSEQRDSQQVAATDAELVKLRKRVADLEEEKRVRENRDAIEAKLAEAKLPEYVITEVFKEQLYLAKSEEDLDKLIEDRRQIAGEADKRRPKSYNQIPGVVATTELPQFSDAKSVADFLYG